MGSRWLGRTVKTRTGPGCGKNLVSAKRSLFKFIFCNIQGRSGQGWRQRRCAHQRERGASNNRHQRALRQFCRVIEKFLLAHVEDTKSGPDKSNTVAFLLLVKFGIPGVSFSEAARLFGIFVHGQDMEESSRILLFMLDDGRGDSVSRYEAKSIEDTKANGGYRSQE